MFGVFDAIKVGTNLTNAQKASSSTIVRGGQFITSNIDAADIDGADIDGGTIDGADLAATNADLNSPDIDGGTIDGTTIGSTTDIVEAEIRFDNRTSNPSGPSEGDAYWNSGIDSLRIYDGSGWRNIGQRGAGYYELTDYTVSRIRWNTTTMLWEDSVNTSDRYLWVSDSITDPTLLSTIGNAQAYCVHIKEHRGLVSFTVQTVIPQTMYRASTYTSFTSQSYTHVVTHFNLATAEISE